MQLLDVMRAALETIKTGVIITSRDGTILFGNKYYDTLSKMEVSRYIGRNIKDFRSELFSENREEMEGKTMLDRCLETGSEIQEIYEYATDDYVLTTVSPIKDSVGEIQYIAYLLVNYSDVMRTEKSLRNSEARENALQSQLQQTMLNTIKNDKIVIESAQSRNIFSTALRVAQTDVSVLLLGESGTGKDVIANFIHNNSARKDKPFIHINLSTIPASLFEAQLFGYKAGAYTGASKEGYAGLIRIADGGTLFLDEIGELPLELQVKILQVIQDREVREVGASKATAVDIRIISATNKDLRELVKQGKFRLDLFYRINTVDITVPPLRERAEDLPRLIHLFLDEYNETYHTEKYMTSSALDLLRNYSWPGNIRELRHVIENICILSSGNRIFAGDLPEEIRNSSGLQSAAQEINAPAADGVTANSRAAGEYTGNGQSENSSLKAAMQSFEKAYISSFLERFPTAEAAAKALGIDASTLSKKRREYHL